jgi:hypothetical protein
MSLQIDFEPLKEMRGFKALWRSIKPHHKAIMILVPVVAILCAVILMNPWLVYLAGLYIFVDLGNASAKQADAAWGKFASANNWYIGPADTTSIVPPTVAELGHRKKISDVITGRLVSGNVFRLFTYRYTQGSGKNSRTYYFTLFYILLEKTFPSLLLDSKKSLAAKRVLKEYGHISLEGDFDTHFNLYAPEANRIDVLSVITPDIMKVLIENNNTQDIEILGNQLWFIVTGDKRDFKSLPTIFGSLDRIMSELNHKAKSYSETLAHNPANVEISNKSMKNLWFSKNKKLSFVIVSALVLLFVMQVLFILRALNLFPAFSQ